MPWLKQSQVGQCPLVLMLILSNPTSLDHDVLMVGYTNDAFIVKNSWDAD